MRRSIHTAVGLSIALAATGCSSLQPQSLELAHESSGAAKIKSIEFSGSGRWFQLGQAPNPDLPWPPFEVKNFTADINYDTASARVQISRSKVVEPGRLRPAPVKQKVDQYVSGSTAWNVPTAANALAPSNPNPYTVNLYENIQKLKLDVDQIAALHGPRVVTLADLRTAIDQPKVVK